MITSVRNFGRCGVTGVYAGFVSKLLSHATNLVADNS